MAIRQRKNNVILGQFVPYGKETQDQETLLGPWHADYLRHCLPILYDHEVLPQGDGSVFC